MGSNLTALDLELYTRPVSTLSNGTLVSIVGDVGNNSYRPNPIEVKVMETVPWVNGDSNLHTASSNVGIFDSDVLFEGESFSYTFDKECEYAYFCDIHPGMVRTVVVTARSP